MNASSLSRKQESLGKPIGKSWTSRISEMPHGNDFEPRPTHVFVPSWMPYVHGLATLGLSYASMASLLTRKFENVVRSQIWLQKVTPWKTMDGVYIQRTHRGTSSDNVTLASVQVWLRRDGKSSSPFSSRLATWLDAIWDYAFVSYLTTCEITPLIYWESKHALVLLCLTWLPFTPNYLACL